MLVLQNVSNICFEKHQKHRIVNIDKNIGRYRFELALSGLCNRWFILICAIWVPKYSKIIPSVHQKHKTPRNRYINNNNFKLDKFRVGFKSSISPSTKSYVVSAASSLQRSHLTFSSSKRNISTSEWIRKLRFLGFFHKYHCQTQWFFTEKLSELNQIFSFRHSNITKLANILLLQDYLFKSPLAQAEN